MLNSLVSNASKIYLVCGATDFRKQIESLSSTVTMQLRLNPYEEKSVYIFCNKRRNSLKVLCYDKNGFILATKKLLEDLKFQWPRTTEDVKKITPQQLKWLLDGLEIEPKRVHHSIKMTVKNNCF